MKKGERASAEWKARMSAIATGNPKYSHTPTEEHRARLRVSNAKPGTAFRKLLASYKQNAKDRDLEFSLTDEQFRELTSSPCYWTGRAPAQISKSDGGETYVYNGIDRLDSTKGYTVENCVPACRAANVAKMDMPVDDFLQFVRDVYQHRLGESHGE